MIYTIFHDLPHFVAQKSRKEFQGSYHPTGQLSGISCPWQFPSSQQASCTSLESLTSNLSTSIPKSHRQRWIACVVTRGSSQKCAGCRRSRRALADRVPRDSGHKTRPFRSYLLRGRDGGQIRPKSGVNCVIMFRSIFPGVGTAHPGCGEHRSALIPCAPYSSSRQ